MKLQEAAVLFYPHSEREYKIHSILLKNQTDPYRIELGICVSKGIALNLVSKAAGLKN